jgi:carboxyl-terminal processing protease
VEQPPPPDPEEVAAEAEAEDSALPRELHEGDLRGALGNDSLSEDELSQIEEDQARAEAAAALREEDYQLAYAIDILKGLSALGPEVRRVTGQQAAEAQAGTPGPEMEETSETAEP